MAKKATPKASSAPKPAAKAAPKAKAKAALAKTPAKPKAAAPAAAAAKSKAAAPKAPAATKSKAAIKTAAAPKAKAAGAKKAAPKKAAAIKLTDAQTSLLKEVAASKDAGVTATKKTQRQIESLQTKKLIKRGKKDGEFFKYHVTKLGEKHCAELGAGASPSASA